MALTTLFDSTLQPFGIVFLPADYFNATTTASPITTAPSNDVAVSHNFFLCYFPANASSAATSSPCAAPSLPTCFTVSADSCSMVKLSSLAVYAFTSVSMVGETMVYSARLFSDSGCQTALLGAQIGVSNVTQGECSALGLPSANQQA